MIDLERLRRACEGHLVSQSEIEYCRVQSWNERGVTFLPLSKIGRKYMFGELDQRRIVLLQLILQTSVVSAKMKNNSHLHNSLHDPLLHG